MGDRHGCYLVGKVEHAGAGVDDEPRRECRSQAGPEPFQVPGVGRRRRRGGLDLDPDQSAIAGLDDNVDLVAPIGISNMEQFGANDAGRRGLRADLGGDVGVEDPAE